MVTYNIQENVMQGNQTFSKETFAGDTCGHNPFYWPAIDHFLVSVGQV